MDVSECLSHCGSTLSAHAFYGKKCRKYREVGSYCMSHLSSFLSPLSLLKHFFFVRSFLLWVLETKQCMRNENAHWLLL